MTNNPSGAIRPPIFMVLWAISSFALQRLWPIELPDPAPVVWSGAVLIVAGALLMGWTQIVFSKHGTAVAHSRPTTALVTDGPFRFTRNPIYLAMLMIFAGLAAAYGNGWALVMTVLFMLALIRYTIRREEDYLAEKFGTDYTRYRESVRRWL